MARAMKVSIDGWQTIGSHERPPCVAAKSGRAAAGSSSSATIRMKITHSLRVGAAEQCCEVAHRPEVGLDGFALAVHLCLLNAEISQRSLGRLALTHELVARRFLVADRGGLGVVLGGDGLVELCHARLDIVEVRLLRHVGGRFAISHCNLPYRLRWSEPARSSA